MREILAIHIKPLLIKSENYLHKVHSSITFRFYIMFGIISVFILFLVLYRCYPTENQQITDYINDYDLIMCTIIVSRVLLDMSNLCRIISILQLMCG